MLSVWAERNTSATAFSADERDCPLQIYHACHDYASKYVLSERLVSGECGIFAEDVAVDYTGQKRLCGLVGAAWTTEPNTASSSLLWKNLLCRK